MLKLKNVKLFVKVSMIAPKIVTFRTTTTKQKQHKKTKNKNCCVGLESGTLGFSALLLSMFLQILTTLLI